MEWRKATEEWMSDCFKGVLGAVIATLLLSFLQYLGAHLSELFHFVSQFAGAFTTIKLTKR